MSKQRNLRQRLSLQNQNLQKNKLKEVLENDDNDNEEEKEVVEEEDVLKNFSEQQRKKEKEEEAKKYLKPIKEEEDPLKYFDKKKSKEAEDEDPLFFIKESEERPSDDLPKTMGIMISEPMTEKTLIEKLNNDDFPDILLPSKNRSNLYTHEERKKKMEKRFKTSLRLTQRKGMEQRAKDKLMQRVQNYKNMINAGDAIKNKEKPNEKKNIGNTLLSAEEQVSNSNNNNTVKTKKEVDLSSFMKKKNEN